MLRVNKVIITVIIIFTSLFLSGCTSIADIKKKAKEPKVVDVESLGYVQVCIDGFVYFYSNYSQRLIPKIGNQSYYGFYGERCGG